MQLTISEIVSSVQGEGKYTGYPTTFIRLFGCNLNCSYCDSLYAKQGRKKRVGVDSVLGTVFKMGNQHVCITGGEPLLQETLFCLIYDLVGRGYIVSIETNGAVEIEDVSSRSYIYCMDIKSPSSGMSDHNCFINLQRLKPTDEVKCVVQNYEDYQYLKGVLSTFPTRAPIIISPCFINGKSNAKEIAFWLLEDRIPNARLGVQIHKLIGVY